MRRTLAVWLAEHMLHFGWALFGQECGCGANRFNWLARIIGEGNWTDDLEPKDSWTKIKFHTGHSLVTAHNYLMYQYGDICDEK